ncbi:unnamed protein product [Meloidogyne enterolobii]|uniref:Uncharacterized protein n=1 Tax=Meloidogyne enterolobii TaxID=390850 RepID=A0ACB0YLG9_MELEN
MFNPLLMILTKNFTSYLNFGIMDFPIIIDLFSRGGASATKYETRDSRDTRRAPPLLFSLKVRYIEV